MSGHTGCLWLLLLGLAFAGCERTDLDEVTTKEKTKTQAVIPLGHGRGTQEFPYTVAEMQEGAKPQSLNGCWVMGYVVGSTYLSFDNAMFEVPTPYDTNILLADDSLCTDVAKCIAVELNKTEIKKQFSLNRCPEHLRHFIVVCGVWGLYFKHTGLRQVSQGYWLPDFDASTLTPAPTEWEEWNEEF